MTEPAASECVQGDVTLILSRIEQGEPQAAEELLPLVYEELRKLAAAKMAQEKRGQTLQATALVHEAYLRLVDVEKAQHGDSRGHFFAAAAEAMRRILIDRARRKRRPKHGGNRQHVDLDEVCAVDDAPSIQLLILDEALTELIWALAGCAFRSGRKHHLWRNCPGISARRSVPGCNAIQRL